ncbi:sugar ABC transporter substrate-binding protein [Chromobacterium haemolyticum]|uniref:Sugar ABC transporter substrate-binding protein n=1 Tax=Chromobacterium haemolyticum TaxID=394935 RepID=A0ABS3GIG6_9NEIS|nr:MULTISPECIES: sugar ABC transporter substrate-binding protein [Chromobacterium]MBK0413741.1 sugar ABC transporter substrate-binding protein [Chromobacterium haemolyticum]MBO0414843.1 sugar ABC transporter substrate-binding protein [Chromobacterium haemolyticum]MBO0498104.1 sugar ABC transporter substrate-binding protein [Chromobacterium haemolyticum]QOZ83536.1 sugar ABC transporter substrate-binding protein [Chromobacterium sp. Rain0013]WON83654.1 sugar ABC transporter substrate-binding pro
MTRPYRFPLAAALLLAGSAHAATLTIATLNNPDMITLKKLSPAFEAQNPGIKLNWVVLEENMLRQRVTTDIATKSGKFDLMTIGTYEAPIWAKKGWLQPMDQLAPGYELADVVKTARDALSYKGQLYALPFYVESSMTYYRKDLFAKLGLNMPERPTYQQIAGFAKTLKEKGGVYGICLRGKAGWGENMAYLSTLVHTNGGRWFDEQWRPTIDSPEWKQSLNFYVDLMRRYGPPGASTNGFNENLTLFASGKCGIWIDATVAAGLLFNPKESQVADKVGFAQAPTGVTPKGSSWLWSWALAVPQSSRQQAAAKQFAQWATSKDYIRLVAKDQGWTSVPPGTRLSTYQQPEYLKAAPFAKFVLAAIQQANPNDPALKKVPYTGIQYVGIPEFQSFGTVVGQAVSGALAGQSSVDAALKAGQAAADRAVRQGGYQKP